MEQYPVVKGQEWKKANLWKMVDQWSMNIISTSSQEQSWNH